VQNSCQELANAVCLLGEARAASSAQLSGSEPLDWGDMKDSLYVSLHLFVRLMDYSIRWDSVGAE